MLSPLIVNATLETTADKTRLTAVVRGAVIFGIENSSNDTTSSMSACPRSYGISADIAFSEIVYGLGEHIRDDLTMKDVARTQLKWLIKKGDLILSDQMRAASSLLKVDFKASQPKTVAIPIFAYDNDDPPDSLTHAQNGSLPFLPLGAVLLEADVLQVWAYIRSSPWNVI
jgi:hypothetical protein